MNKMLLLTTVTTSLLCMGAWAKIHVKNNTPYPIKAIVYYGPKRNLLKHTWNMLAPGKEVEWTEDKCKYKQGIDVWVKEPIEGTTWNQGEPDLQERSKRGGCGGKGYLILSSVEQQNGLQYDYSIQKFLTKWEE